MSISLSHIKKFYKQGDSTIPVLQDVNLKIDEESICIISGESGCGKTTLLSIIGAIEHPDAGEIIVHNHRVHDMEEDEVNTFRKEVVSCIFQSHFLLKDFTAIENLMIPLLLKGWKKGKARSHARDYLARVGLSHRGDHRPHALSGGECQRIAVARAVITDAAVILADEPTGNLDYDTAHQIIALLQNLVVEDKKTLFLVTHNREILSLGDTTYELSQGCLYPLTP